MYLVLDTSVFTNPDCHKELGATSVEALSNVLRYNALHPSTQLFVTPGCVEELKTLMDWNKLQRGLLVHLRIKSPSKGNLYLPAELTYEMVCEFRSRGEKTLKFASDLVREAYGIVPQPRVTGQPDPVHGIITRLRDGVRKHLRTNFLDSGPDMDTLLLAWELDGKLISGDLGLLQWANKLGLETMDSSLLLHYE